jgi:hypothetical protein
MEAKMARWRLAAPHYLNVEGTSWEYKEVDRTSGRQKRTIFPVPLHLDPDNPGDWNIVRGKDDGEIVVADRETPENPKDIIFTGLPTPDMVPLDDEAKALSTKMAPKWKHPIESLTGTYADEMMKDLSDEMDAVRAKSGSTQVEGMTELLTAMTGMMKQNQEMMAALLHSRTEPEPKAARRA